MRVLILGVTGMLGSAVYRKLASGTQYETWGTLRRAEPRRFFSHAEGARLIDGIDATDWDSVRSVMMMVRPDVIVNAIGVIKQLAIANDPQVVLPVNAIFPHKLAELCKPYGTRMIQLSSDCVYSGSTGNYTESDAGDAHDLYGRSKYAGEVRDQGHVITLRTSGIGHELVSSNGLLEWFLSQTGPIRGFANAIYSGLPTVELARVIDDFVLPNPELHGLYHVSAKPISKLDLLRLIAGAYGKKITIEVDESVRIDRSLNSARFTKATGFVADDWPRLIAEMHSHRTKV
jgi:dTDP-4-dehydrorhamnose reductase